MTPAQDANIAAGRGDNASSALQLQVEDPATLTPNTQEDESGDSGTSTDEAGFDMVKLDKLREMAADLSEAVARITPKKKQKKDVKK